MNKLIEIKIQRTSKDGLQIFLKSDLEWSIFSNTERSCKIGGIFCYYPKQEQIEDCPGKFGVDDMFDYGGDFPNLTILLAKNIKEGATFNFGKYPVSQDRIGYWLQKFKEQTKIIYFTYFKEFDISMVFTTSIVENERD